MSESPKWRVEMKSNHGWLTVSRKARTEEEAEELIKRYEAQYPTASFRKASA